MVVGLDKFARAFDELVMVRPLSFLFFPSRSHVATILNDVLWVADREHPGS